MPRRVRRRRMRTMHMMSLHRASIRPVLLAAVSLRMAGACGAAPIPVTSFQQDANGVTFAMDPGVMRVQVCGERIVRVIYAPGPELPAGSGFVVNADWPASSSFDVAADAEAIVLSTDALAVRIDRATGALRFLDSFGAVLLEEPADGGKSMPPTTVNGEETYRPTQVFVSPADEALFGLGQFQEGLWNYRGIPLQLRQSNTQIAVPMLISSKGYGLLWDNASLTDFNPADAQVAIDPVTRRGTFRTGAAGPYVFMVRDGNLNQEIGVSVNGVEVARIVNRWVPPSVSGKIDLPAETDCVVRLHGGGNDAKVFARPLGETTAFRSEVGDAIDYFLFYGPGLDDVIRGYRLATGAPPMLPRWALGFWQCRERYSSQQELLEAAAGFRSRRIPVDLIVQDWQYWGEHGWGAYQWDAANYPDPEDMIGQLHAQHFKFMISVWSNPQGELGTALAAMTPSGRVQGGNWMDVFNPAVRELRWDAMDSAFFSIGTDAWWQDATEPGDDGNALVDRTVYLESVPHSGNRVRNAYPLFASRAAYEGQRGTDSQKRVVNLTRSAYPGQQRYGAICWSGDVRGDWIGFRRQIAAGLNFSLTGMPWWTTDTGGFFRPADQYVSSDFNELLIRWFQWSTFCPVLRMHGFQSSTELWNYLPATQARLLESIRLRYRMLPYNYSVAWMATDGGSTILRALPMDFPDDPVARGVSDQYMFGPAFLVSPVTTPKATSRVVYLPAGTDWIDFWTGEAVSGGQTIAVAAPIDRIPLHVRAGSVVPFGPELQWTGEKTGDPIEVRVYRGADGVFTLYDDAGDGYGYEQGERATIGIHWNDEEGILSFDARQGSFPGMATQRTFRVLWVGPGHGHGMPIDHPADVEVLYDGSAIAVEIPDVSPPAAPTGVAASSAAGQIFVSWDPVAEATAYVVQRAMASGGPYDVVGVGLAETAFTEDAVIPGATHYYVVIAGNLAGESPPSAEASVEATAAPSLVWNAPGGVWDDVSENWLDGDTPVAWSDAPLKQAVFGPVGIGTVTLAVDVSAAGLRFRSPGYRILGAMLDLPAPYPTVIADENAVVSSRFSDNSGLVKLGPGTLTLDGRPAYAGPTRVVDGVLCLKGGDAIDFFRSSTEIDAGKVLELDVAGLGGIHIDGLMDPLQPALGRGSVIEIAGDGTLRIAGTAADVVGIGNTSSGAAVSIALGTKDVPGSGLIDIQGGALVNGGWAGAVWTNNFASMHIGADGAFDIWDGHPVFLDALTGEGALTNGSNSPALRSLTIGVNDGSGVFGGSIGGGGGAGKGIDRISLTKTGAGVQVLNGTGTYAGPTTVLEGALMVNGRLDSPSVTVAAGATLGGAGMLEGSVTVDGYLAPGAGGIGVLHTGPVTLRGVYLCEIDATDSDTLAVDGPLTLAGATLSFRGLAAPRASAYTIATCVGPAPGFPNVENLPPGYRLESSPDGTIRLLAVAGYLGWSARHGLTGGPYDDDDGDGIANVVEYALGTDPNRPDPRAGALDGNVLSFGKGSEAVAAGDVEYWIEVSETLAPGSWMEVVPDIDDDSLIAYVLETGGGDRLFARLRIEWTGG